MNIHKPETYNFGFAYDWGPHDHIEPNPQELSKKYVSFLGGGRDAE